MSRYLQKISLRPYSDSEIWTGWELEGRSGEIEGLILAVCSRVRRDESGGEKVSH